MERIVQEKRKEVERLLY